MRIIRVFAPVIAMMFSAGLTYAGGDTGFTYQGRLLDAGEPANGLFDFEFSLWDAEVGGNQIDGTVVLNNVDVADGLFTVQIDFGQGAFNEARWLEIVVNGTTLSPRSPVSAAPLALQMRGMFIDPVTGFIGINHTSPNARLHIESENDPGLYVQTTGHNGIIIQTSAVATWGVRATASHPSGHGLFGEVVAGPTGTGVGVLGTSVADQGIGVEGRATNDFGFGNGVKGTAFSSEGHGVHGENLEGGFAGYFVGDGYFSGNVGIGTTTTNARLRIGGIESSGLIVDGPFAGDGNAVSIYGITEGSTLRSHNDGTGHAGYFVGNGYFSGNVGIGTTTPQYPLHVVSAGTRTIFAHNTAATGVRYGVYGQSDSTSGLGVFGFATGVNGIGVYGSGGQYGVYSIGDVCTTGSYQTCSDGRFKENVQPLADSLDKILMLRGVQFDWKRDEFPDHNFSEDRQVGFIAQEVAEILPDLVAGGEGEDAFYSVSYGRLVPILVEAIKELNGEVEYKDSQITELQARLTALETLVDRLVLDRNGGAK